MLNGCSAMWGNTSNVVKVEILCWCTFFGRFLRFQVFHIDIFHADFFCFFRCIQRKCPFVSPAYFFRQPSVTSSGRGENLLTHQHTKDIFWGGKNWADLRLLANRKRLETRFSDSHMQAHTHTHTDIETYKKQADIFIAMLRSAVLMNIRQKSQSAPLWCSYQFLCYCVCVCVATENVFEHTHTHKHYSQLTHPLTYTHANM